MARLSDGSIRVTSKPVLDFIGGSKFSTSAVTCITPDNDGGCRVRLQNLQLPLFVMPPMLPLMLCSVNHTWAACGARYMHCMLQLPSGGHSFNFK